MEQEIKNLELQGDRVVSFTDRGVPFTYTLNRIRPEDWKKFWAELQINTQVEKNQRTRTSDNTSPAVDLVTRLVKSVDGYKLTSDAPFTSMPNWRERLPLGHRAHVGSQLQDVRFDDGADFVFDPEYEVVKLRARWGSNEPGTMVEHSGLIHRLNPVTGEQQRRVRRAQSQSIVVGGSRSDQTIYPSIHHLYVELYDELIVNVEGYAVGGSPISTADEARGQMDAMHKFGAVMALFRSPETEVEAA